MGNGSSSSSSSSSAAPAAPAPPEPAPAPAAAPEAPESDVVEEIVEVNHDFKDKSKARLMIEFVKMHNFKSYGGDVKVGNFVPNFSCINGANGSGKSNTIDALQFVFGRNARKIRMDKLSSLIHRSDKLGKPDKCRVDVHFCMVYDSGYDERNPHRLDRFTKQEGSEFSISREALKNNSSKYYVDGKKVTEKEVTTKLKNYGIDLDHNRFLILQGEVEQISLMKPKGDEGKNGDFGFLEYLEDIIGSNQYVDDIEASAKKLEELDKVRQEKQGALRVAEAKENALRNEKSAAEAFITHKTTELACQSIIKQKERLDIEDAQDNLRKEGEQLVQEMTQYDTHLQEATK